MKDYWEEQRRESVNRVLIEDLNKTRVPKVEREPLTVNDILLACAERQHEWDPKGLTGGLLYRAVELGGEAGEVLNVAKKLEREALGIPGSRDTKEHLAEELADVVICAALMALAAGIDLAGATVAKFNKTSDEVGLKTKL